MLYKEIKSTLEVSFNNISEMTISVTINKLLEEFNKNSKITENLNAIKGLISFIKNSK